MSNTLTLLGRRAVIMGQPQGGIPYDAEVEYLVCDGTQYVDSGLFGDNNTRMDFDLITTNSTYSQTMAGSKGGSGKGIYPQGRLNGTTDQIYGDKTAGMSWYNKRYLISFRPDGFYVDNTLKKAWSPSEFTTQHSLWFGKASTGDRGLIGKIYGAKIYKNGDLKFDGIPVRKGTIGYLYDRISGKLFANVGTGDFELGPDVTQ